MDIFAEYIERIDNPNHRARMVEVLEWVSIRFPNLVPRIAWNQPMFTDHGTFIIGFSVAKKHMAVGPERVVIQQFSQDIKHAGYEHSNELIRIPWDSPLDLSLLEKIIEYNILDKVECTTFWRK